MQDERIRGASSGRAQPTCGLLAYVDQAQGALSGPATRRILQREYTEYHIQAYQRLAGQTSHHQRRAPQARSQRTAGLVAHRPGPATPLRRQCVGTTSVVGRLLLDMVDHQDGHRPFLLDQFQPELLIDGLEE